MSRSALTSLFVASVVLVIALGTLLAVPGASLGRNGTATGLLVFALAISGWQLTMTAIAPRPAAASMMVHLFFVFFLILPALFQLATNTYAHDMSIYKEATATKAAILVLLFVVCFAAGGALGPKRLDRALGTVEACERRRRGALVIAFVLAAAAIALGAILGFGLDTLVANRTAVSTHMAEEETKATAGLFLDLPRAITFCAVLAVLYLFGRRAARRGDKRRTAAILLGLLILPLFAIVNYPQSLPRFWLFGMAIAVLLLYLDLRRVRNRLLVIAAIAGGAYTVFPLVRDLTTTESLGPEIGMRPVAEELITGNFDGFEMIMNIVIAVERFGHTLGHQLLSALLFFVPRAVWEGKAVPSGYYTAEKLGFHFTNLSAPTPGELYLDFSYPGVVIGALAVGYAYRKADTLYAASLAFGGVSLHRIQAAMLAGFTIILMRGALLAVIALIATSFAANVLLMVAPRLSKFFSGSRPR